MSASDHVTTAITGFDDWYEASRRQALAALERSLPAADESPARLHEAMRYAVLGDSAKRVRAVLVYAAGAACGATGPAPSEALDGAAAAVELIHAYSLVHDDLPCMDDDVLRRGQPTVHVKYDEATAMLAADAMQPLAFDCLARMPVAPALTVQAVRTLAVACGSLGMVGGQAIDLASVGHPLDRTQLETMHRMKTGALLHASVALGAIVCGAGSSARRALDAYARAIGLAFQVVDDVLDVTADTALLGKTAGKDAREDKPTYVSILGLDAARALAEQLRLEAHAAIAPLGGASARLVQLADYIVLRQR